MNRGRSAGLPPGANQRCFNEPGRSPALRFMVRLNHSFPPAVSYDVQPRRSLLVRPDLIH